MSCRGFAPEGSHTWRAHTATGGIRTVSRRVHGDARLAWKIAHLALAFGAHPRDDHTMLEPRRELPKLTDRYPLGNGLEISPFCLGLVGDEDVVPAAFEAGINFFFISADMHWPVYEQTRRGLDMIKRIAAQGIGVVIITHIMAQAFQVADRMVVIRQGKVAGNVERVKTSPDEVVRMITGESL